MNAYLILNSNHPMILTKNFKVAEYAVFGNSSEVTHNLAIPETPERQFCIYYRQNHFWIRDLRSTNPTYVNQSPVQEGPLAEGDIIQSGELEFRFTKTNPESNLDLKSNNLKWDQELERIGHAARTQFSMLILGPSGAGKDVLAQAIHKASNRASAPMISVNCSSLSETLVESELFGHIKGSFTGAIADRKGAFESARGGTLFLDEIGDLPLPMQAKLLRALENNEIRPIGSDNIVKTDVRIIAATHQNLLEKIKEGKFRADLFYRLNVVSIKHPSLAERIEDFENLLHIFTKEFKVRIHADALDELKKHAWTGNIRELKNFVARASALYPGHKISAAYLPQLLSPYGTEVENKKYEIEEDFQPIPMPVIRDIEKQVIIKRLIANKGNQRKTALELGLPKSTLHDRLKAYDICPKDFRI